MNFYKSSKMTKWGISIKSALNSNLVGNLSYSRTFNNILGQGDTSHLEDDGQGCSILMSKLPSMSSLLRTIHIDLQMPAKRGHQIQLWTFTIGKIKTKTKENPIMYMLERVKQLRSNTIETCKMINVAKLISRTLWAGSLYI